MKKKTLLNALLLAPLLLANGLLSGQETEALPPPDQLVQWLDSADFYQRQSATAGLVTQQSGAVVPVLERYLQDSHNLEIRTRCYRILMRLLEAEPFTDAKPAERYGLSRRLLALDPSDFPELGKQLAEMRSLAINPSLGSNGEDLSSALESAGIRVENSGPTTLVYLEDSWDRPADQLQPIRSIKAPLTFIFGLSYKYEYLRQILGANVQEFRFHSNQYSPAGQAIRRSYPIFEQRDMRLLGRFDKLRSLDIAYVRIAPDTLHHLAALGQLERLSLGGNFQDANLKFLSQLTELAHLDIRAAKETEGDFLVHVAPLKKLTSLNIETAKVGDEHLKNLRQLPNLKTLYAPRTMGDQGLEHLATIASLEVLVLPESSVTQKGLASLSELENLYHLTIHMKRLDGEALTAIAKLKGLTSLRMTNSGLSGKDLVALSQLPKLKFLSIESKQISAPGLLDLGQHLDSLEHLEILQHGLSEQDFQRFRASYPEIKLTHRP